MDDPEAGLMRVLYRDHAAALWRYAVRLTGDPARAEDVVQETLLRAWQHPEVTDSHPWPGGLDIFDANAAQVAAAPPPVVLPHLWR